MTPTDPTRSPLFIIAGPCVIESAEICLTVGRHVRDICRRLDLPYVFKASFDKANRSSSDSFRGPGLQDGLIVLQRIREELGVPVLTDVHETAQVAPAAEAVDILQVPAFLARQTDLLIACGRTGRTINIKKGQFMSRREMAHAIEKVRAARLNSKSNDTWALPSTIQNPESDIWLTERGTFFGYNRLVNDFTALPQMKQLGCCVVFDATHSTQQPAAQGDTSGGSPEYAPILARAAIAAGADALFLECHPDPASAKSDAATMLHLDAVEPLLRQCRQLADLRQSWDVASSRLRG